MAFDAGSYAEQLHECCRYRDSEKRVLKMNQNGLKIKKCVGERTFLMEAIFLRVCPRLRNLNRQVEAREENAQYITES